MCVVRSIIDLHVVDVRDPNSLTESAWVASFPRKNDPTSKYHYHVSFPFVKALPCHIIRKKQYLGSCLIPASFWEESPNRQKKPHIIVVSTCNAVACLASSAFRTCMCTVDDT